MRLAPQETRTYMVTAVTAQRRRLFQVTPTADLMQAVLLDYRTQGKYLLHAFIVMPDHIHVLLTPAPDVSLEKAVQFLKGNFSFRLQRKQDVWERSFNQTQILTEEKFIACRDYIEDNPIEERLADSAENFPHSSKSTPDSIDPMPAHLRAKS